MGSRLVVLVVTVVAAASVIFAISHFVSSSRPGATSASLPPNQASYLGVYETGPPDTYQPAADFARVAETQPNLVGYYSGWGEPFKTSFAETVRSHGAVTIIQWDPTLVPVAKIAAGDYDGYLRSFADSVWDSATRSSSASGTR